MSNSPLLLERHLFKQVSIVASEKPDLKTSATIINLGLGVARHQTDSSRFLVRLDVKLLGESEKPAPGYTGEIIVEGYFRSTPEAEIPFEVAIANGATLLYGAIREMILTVTSRGPWPGISLATVSFGQLAKNLVSQAEKAPTFEPRSAERVSA